ncbi:putative disease resistance protein rga4 [Quercus suber]|uniref:Disease resistance protein rga4 n=1 Tax=Quercus suber TaxID=58331 RepID=A0AAW0LHR6_QUESU
MEWRHLNRLSHLEFHSLPKLNSLPAGLQHVTTLKMLTISHCENLKTLPRWIRKLISLESLIIGDCHNLKSLPNEMRDLTSLQCLGIFSCPELRKRCEKETGQDWNKIAHITTDDSHPKKMMEMIVIFVLVEYIIADFSSSRNVIPALGFIFSFL